MLRTDTTPSQNFDMRQCIAEGKVAQACEQEKEMLQKTEYPEKNGGTCIHDEGVFKYTYILGGSGPWAGSHCQNIEKAVRKIHMSMSHPCAVFTARSEQVS